MISVGQNFITLRFFSLRVLRLRVRITEQSLINAKIAKPAASKRQFFKFRTTEFKD